MMDFVHASIEMAGSKYPQASAARPRGAPGLFRT